MEQESLRRALRSFQNDFLKLMKESIENGLLKNIEFIYHDPDHYLFGFEIPENKHTSYPSASKYTFIIKVEEIKDGQFILNTIGTNIYSDNPTVFLYKIALRTHEIIQFTTMP